jgi:hypothetical protein
MTRFHAAKRGPKEEPKNIYFSLVRRAEAALAGLHPLPTKPLFIPRLPSDSADDFS